MNREQRRKAEKEGKQIQIVSTDLPDMGSARLYAYIDETNKRPIGHVLVFEPFIFKDVEPIIKGAPKTKEMVGIDRAQCIIWDTIVSGEYREQGMGSMMLNALKEVYDKMLSGARSEAGKALAIKCGFQLMDDGRYFWEKAKDVK